jgi:hypothetical protein
VTSVFAGTFMDVRLNASFEAEMLRVSEPTGPEGTCVLVGCGAAVGSGVDDGAGAGGAGTGVSASATGVTGVGESDTAIVAGVASRVGDAAGDEAGLGDAPAAAAVDVEGTTSVTVGVFDGAAAVFAGAWSGLAVGPEPLDPLQAPPSTTTATASM